MAKLLNTRLPLAVNDVDAPVFNRLVRILELNLDQFDPNSTPQFTDSQIVILNFNAVDVICNSSVGVLQVYTGNKWVDLHTPVDPHGFEASAELGNIDIKTNGDITITL